MSQLNNSILRDLFEGTEAEARQRLNDYLQTFKIPALADGQLQLDLAGKALAANLGATSFQNIAGTAGLLEKANLGQLENTRLSILGGDAHPDDGAPTIKEVRFDWDASFAETPILHLPAVELSAPREFRLSLVLKNTFGNGHLPHRALLTATLDADDTTPFSAKSNLAWRNQEDSNAAREVQNDDKRTEEGKPPLLAFSLNSKAAQAASVVLLDFELDEARLPGFFQLLEDPLPPLDTGSPDNQETEIKFVSFTDSWEAGLDFNLLSNEAFTLPFLKNNKDGGSKGIQQFIDIVGLGSPEAFLSQSEIKIPLNFNITFGKLIFGSGLDMFFNWKDFAFRVEHSGGIGFLMDDQIQEFPEFLGLNWHFIAAETADPAKFHLFTLVIKDQNYQIQMADGARLIIEYTKLSEDPIAFAISDFAISAKGISLTAEVLNIPIKLNGVDTKFTFEGTTLSIVENEIQDFTLMGSGPLPPALAGDAMVDIMLQFSQQADGNLTLASGGAKLQKNKMLQAKNTRFNFQLDSIGLQFVNENGFHLFFIMTGSAAFSPARGDSKDGPLAPLSMIKIEFVDCPLTGDASVIAKHVNFLVELPKPISFSFLGCFSMEIRSLGFIPSAEPFDGDPAMQLSGQVMFSTGGYDTKSARADFHGLYIGVPAKGSFIPRISLKQLSLEVQFGAAFRLAGMVSFIDTQDRTGFEGSGLIEIKGLPSISATFAFLRVRRDADGHWLRAWFIYLEANRISLEIPVVKLFLREVGLGFGYRYTLTSIKAAEESQSIAEMIRTLRELSKTQGNLSSLEAWATDIEAPGEDLRWTIVLKAVISQTSASAPIKYNQAAETALACTFLFDAVIAFRSDLTFLMAIRLWLNTNYNDYYENADSIRNYPLMSGFVHLDPVNKRFLASAATNPDGKLGNHPPFPPFMETALQNSQFSMTLLIEPGLFHYEMGWPNLLAWKRTFGPMELEERGGFVFRITRKEMVIGISYTSRGSLSLSQEVDYGVVGVEVSALAEVAFGARFIGVTSFEDPVNNMALYGIIGLEVRVRFSVRFWVDLALFSASKSFSLDIGFTASLELALMGSNTGVRGKGTVSVSALGKSIRFDVKVAFGESAVAQAKNKTAQYLDIGLEMSADVPDLFSFTGGRLEAQARGVGGALAMPGYNMYIIYPEEGGGSAYFVFYPQGENGAMEEQGFLPAPPAASTAVTSDFKALFPSGSYTIRQLRADGPDAPKTWDADSNTWAVNWDAPVFSSDNGETALDNEEPVLTLGQLMRMAFVDDELDGLADPAPQNSPESLADSRVHNPSGEAFEEAVIGALEQFRGSPYFKHDPNNEYEKALAQALSVGTTIYSDNGEAPEAGDPAADARQRADQMRGIIVQQLFNDLREYVEKLRNGDQDLQDFKDTSVAFQMGLVFELTPDAGAALPGWLSQNITYNGDDASPNLPIISQRIGEDEADAADSNLRPAGTFNIEAATFANNPPQFERIRHYTDANTIAITWDLVWNEIPDPNCTPCQSDPEHHLMHYRVLRRTLDNSEPDASYTVKKADVLHRDGSVLTALQPRFQVVDHFNRESLESQATLPSTGRTYLYTITPVDFSGYAGRPISVIATRYPNQPPQAPVESELLIRYPFANTAPPAPVSVGADPFQAPSILAEADSEGEPAIKVSWKDPLPPREGPRVAIGRYYLVFRKEEVQPLGSYGLDSTIQGPRSRQSPLANTRALPTDIKIPVEAVGTSLQRSAERVETDDGSAKSIYQALREEGALSADGNWLPDSWSVFIQAISVNGVPSALTPVQILLRFEVEGQDGFEERRPAQLEFLPAPLSFSLLPPEDMMASTGNAHFPMFAEGSSQFGFTSNLTGLEHRQHPAGIRAIRFLWNQAPSSMKDYPLRLNAGYDILQLDVDAHTTETFNDKEELAKAVKEIQEVRLAPAGNMLLIPGDTLSTSQWEAWYPSSMLRWRREGERPEGSQTPFGPWNSWRESILLWPEWEGLTEAENTAPQKEPGAHPLLKAIMEAIEGDGSQYLVNQQIPTPIQPETEMDFLNNTAAKNDPYGWGVLQRLGLSAAFSVRDTDTGELITADNLLGLVKTAIDHTKAITGDDGLLVWDARYFDEHLFAELLFQQSRSVELEAKATDAGRLLGIIQLSLRPAILETHEYAGLTITGPANTSMNIVFKNLAAGSMATLIDRARPSQGERQLEPEDGATTIKTGATLPISGSNELLLRAPGALPGFELEFALKAGGYTAEVISSQLEIKTGPDKLIVQPEHFKSANFTSGNTELDKRLKEGDRYILDCRIVLEAGTENALIPFTATDEPSTFFTMPPSLAADIEDGQSDAWRNWIRFKRLAEADNSNEDSAPKIEIPAAGAGLEKFLPDFVGWSQRFMSHSAPVAGTAGPWMATAYPRAGSPAYASPDESARVKYDHLLEDKWAHNYRYYIRPFGRYGLLWESLLKSPALFPGNPGPALKTLPDPAQDAVQGALDVVLHRTQPVAVPLVLGSRRLDEPSVPGNPAAPGTIWEVIVAQHSEQALMEHNQTLYRQLSFRQIAFTLLRRFSQQDMQDKLAALFPDYFSAVTIEEAVNQRPAIPADLADAPAHIGLSQDEATADINTKLSLRLPERLARFSQNAMALQWEALPFFYEQKLMLIAQTADTVSRPVSVSQKDFHYQSPMPQAFLRALDAGGGERQPQILIPLKRLWDALSPKAQLQWDAEAPGSYAGAQIKYSALPDLEAVYQLIEMFYGNMEVQTEYYFGEDTDTGQESYLPRQLAQRFVPGSMALLEAGDSGNPLDAFVMDVQFLLPLEVLVLKDYTSFTILSPTGGKVVQEGQTLRFTGILRQEDIDNILWNAVQELVELRDYVETGIDETDAAARADFLARRYSSRHLESQIALSPEQEAKVEILEEQVMPTTADFDPALHPNLAIGTDTLNWTGEIGTDQESALQAFIDDTSVLLLHQARVAADALKAQLAAINRNNPFVENYVPLKDPFPNKEQPAKLETSFSNPDLGSNKQARWTLKWPDGVITDDEIDALRELKGDSILDTSESSVIEDQVNTLLDSLKASHSVTIVPGTPKTTPAGAPGGFIVATKTAVVNGNSVETERNLSWSGILTTEIKNQLEGLSGDQAFTDGVKALIESINTDPLINTEHQVSFDMDWPVRDPSKLGNSTELNDISLDLNNNEASWARSHQISALLASLESSLKPIDPFLVALQAIRDEIAGTTLTETVAPAKLLHYKLLDDKNSFFSEKERDGLLAIADAGGHSAINDFYKDLADWRALQDASRKFFSEVEVSQAPPGLDPIDPSDPLQKFFSFEDKDGKSYLQYHGWMLEGERDEFYNAYNGLPADQEAVQQLYEASQRKMIYERDIRICCRRGAAAPSSQEPFSFMKPGA